MKGGLSRRSFLLGATALTATAGSASAHVFRGDGVPWHAGRANAPWYGTQHDIFFTPAERETVDAITARLIPSDETGPGAREADVVTFIDRQLGGFYGEAPHWYMQGPFPEEPLDTQGYQLPQTPAQLWRDGLAALDAHCRQAFSDRGFAELTEDEQDEVLAGLKEGEIELEGVSGEAFFGFVHEMTIEGFFCDPIYGGNRDMAGWRYVGFPGARYDYRDYVGHGGRPIEIEPVGLLGSHQWNR